MQETCPRSGVELEDDRDDGNRGTDQPFPVGSHDTADSPKDFREQWRFVVTKARNETARAVIGRNEWSPVPIRDAFRDAGEDAHLGILGVCSVTGSPVVRRLACRIGRYHARASIQVGGSTMQWSAPVVISLAIMSVFVTVSALAIWKFPQVDDFVKVMSVFTGLFG